MSNVINGSDLILMVSGATGYQAVAHATSHSIDITRDVREISSKSTGDWNLKQYSNINWSASADALVSFDSGVVNYETLVDKMLNKETVRIVSIVKSIDLVDATGYTLDNSSFETGAYYQGDAIVTSVNISASNGDNSTFSVSFEAYSALSKQTISA